MQQKCFVCDVEISSMTARDCEGMCRSCEANWDNDDDMLPFAKIDFVGKDNFTVHFVSMTPEAQDNLSEWLKSNFVSDAYEFYTPADMVTFTNSTDFDLCKIAFA